MKTIFVTCLVLVATNALAEEAKWACMKSGSSVEVAGKTDGDKKKDCEAKKGKWSKAEAEKEKPAKTQSAGDGGGW